ncbi:uncharacterized protein LOC121728251 [Aricia agestis]|uniref:uncharacterized protein LOC121728251 n=1 Tax=Aricia agestis TaxID=91739 RepID=UPI001C20B4D5|nr:uncharacterized protein LOC121728251 [Aricia agestis]
MWRAVVLLAAVSCASAREFTSEEIYKLPELYQIDDYDRCLSRPGALYCVGTFRLTADRQAPSYRYYRMIEEYSADPLHFNRRLLHRGYCVSSRCSSTGSNSSELFLNCVREHEKQLGMEISLETHKCDVNSDHLEQSKENYDEVLLWVVGAFLCLNFLGTLYDTFVTSEKKNKFLLAWSLPYNWDRLTRSHAVEKDGSSSPLLLIQGTRLLINVIIISGHVLTITHHLFINNPHDLEKVYKMPIMMILRNGSNFVQMFVMISNFLFTYSLIQISKQRKIGFLQLPIFVAHRIIRILPIHLLGVGLAATWWRYTGDGPLWPNLVLHESDVCRRKFLWHALFLHNLVDNDDHCLPQTWFLAMDMQMLIVASLVLITLMKTGRKPLPILSGLFVLCVIMNGCLAYYLGWKPPLHIVNPESLRIFFRGSRTLRNFYISPWGSLPACLLGIMTGYVYEGIREGRLNFSNNTLFMWFSHMSLPLAFSWVLAGSWVFQQQAPLFSALYLAVERPVLCALLCVLFIGMVTSADNILRRVLSWRGAHVLARLSLPVLMVHWCIIKVIVGSTRTLTDFTLLNTAIETLATCVFSYCLAVPLTLLVEMPLMKTFTSVLMD